MKNLDYTIALLGVLVILGCVVYFVRHNDPTTTTLPPIAHPPIEDFEVVPGGDKG